jgi:hypothetical protein
LAPADKLKLAPADKLKRETQAVLTPDLARTKYWTGHGDYDGFGYVAAEAYFHLAGGYRAGLRPTQLTYRGKSHWWLTDHRGRVIDMTLGPREKSAFPYHRGKHRSFRYTPAGISGGAQTIVKRVRTARRK